MKVRAKTSAVIVLPDGSAISVGKGKVLDLPDETYVLCWELFDRVGGDPRGEIADDTVKVLKAPKAKPYAETASMKPTRNAAMKKPKQKKQ